MASTTQEIERLEGRIERLEEEVKKILNLIQPDSGDEKKEG
jgi:hypothetical protein